jgi:hypothetical protein
MLMQCLHKHPLSCLTALRYQTLSLRAFSSAPACSLHRVPLLSSWDSEPFQAKAYIPALPFQFPRSRSHLPPACSKWFTHHHLGEGGIDSFDDADFSDDSSIPRSSELNTSFWSKYEDALVPLELTSKGGSDSLKDETFQRTEAPLGILLGYLSSNVDNPSTAQKNQRNHSIYLAQCSLTALPPSLQQDLPTPSLIARSGPIKGDIYASSLWLGRPPTYTPLHRDPNPNLFIQLAGRKVVRLLPPEVGAAVFADVQARIHQDKHVAQSASSTAIRGEEMMSGPEKAVLEAAIWPSGDNDNENSGGSGGDPSSQDLSPYAEVLTTYAQEATLGMGDALFIPKGWWHSVKGVGAGVTASANWWFR